MNADIHLHIDRLVIDRDVLGDADPRALAAEVRAELTALISARGLDRTMLGGARARVHGGRVREPHPLGTGIATAILSGLTGPSEGSN
ncbi:MAG TPA: hypothetical protein PJ992_05205 [Arachnia sp.]|nr:hypothetical protein [Arachnia sp.]HMR12462.1 hypothetical protein [Arachnia sp.]